jgi:hypothetical protein
MKDLQIWVLIALLAGLSGWVFRGVFGTQPTVWCYDPEWVDEPEIAVRGAQCQTPAGHPVHVLVID